MIAHISVLIVKYWLRLKDSLHEEDLFGKAAKLCISYIKSTEEYNSRPSRSDNYMHGSTDHLTTRTTRICGGPLHTYKYL
jgi:hypothetical protein